MARCSFSTLFLYWVLAATAIGADAPGEPKVSAIKPPTGPDSTAYQLATSKEGDIYLSWIEKGPRTDILRFSRLEGRRWGESRTIAEGANWLVNWVDRPAMAASDKVMLAHWLERTVNHSGTGSGYGLRVARSDDGGEDWHPAFDLGMDNTTDYTGFGAFLPSADGFLMGYLDPLRDPSEQGLPGDRFVKTLRLLDVGHDGQVRADVLLDADVCSCCPLGIAETDAGPVVVYRDHDVGEIRDISIVRAVDGTWTQPETVFRDGWRINGCPTSGPAIATKGNSVAVAWFTKADNEPRLRLALSNSGGAKFSQPLQVDDGDPMGYPDVVITPADEVIVSWLERSARQKGKARLMLRTVAKSGGLGVAVTVGVTSAGRGAGIPQLAQRGHDLVLAWKSDKGV